ncbi:MAG: aspartyl protease family protein [Steroidobacteraceae bacterium]
MRLTYASLRLTNTFTGLSIEVQALVDSGAMPLCIPESVARQLGFDTTETYSARIKIADASRIKVPVVAPIRIEFANRSCTTDAYVFGDEPLIGVIPIEAMDCIIEPRHRRLVVNPDHPDCAEIRV